MAMQRLLWRQVTKSSSSTTSISSSLAGRFRASAFAFPSPRATATTTSITRPATRRAYSTQPPKGPNSNVKFWPFVIIIAAGTGGYALLVNTKATASTSAHLKLQTNKYPVSEMPAIDKKAGEIAAPAKDTPTMSGTDVTVVFVLGGPGAGKGTQCANLVKDYGFTHLSAGDLLRAEQDRPGSQFGDLIKDYIKNGLIVPMEVTVQLLENAMVADLDRTGAGDIKGRKGKFLIDGFPRKMDQAHKFEESVCPAKLVLFYDCSEEEMEKRLINRGKTSGRSDDNAESIRKRFRTFVETSMPVVEYYEKNGKVVNVDAKKTSEEVYADTKKQLEGRLGTDTLQLAGN
ncbi:uridylate kinase [Xylariales sp. AK1849]|nr:uridylate kinase [Xylariales sp. AK1849]